MGAKSKANQAHLTNLSKQNPGSWKAIEDASDSDVLDWIIMPKIDEISDLEAEGMEGDDKAEIKNEAALLNFSSALSEAQEIATSSARSKDTRCKKAETLHLQLKEIRVLPQCTQRDLVVAS